MRLRIPPACPPALLLFQAGFGSRQSALDPAGPYAAKTLGLFWLMLAVGTLVLVVVLAAAAYALFRRRRPAGAPEEEDEHARTRRMTRWVGGAVAGSIVLLFAFLAADLAVSRDVQAAPRGQTPLTIEVTGHQWWWEVRYLDPSPQRILTTANEIHVPVGRPVQLRMRSADVIHSFWVPNLRGKRDLVPGHTTRTWMQADEAGVFRGQCAEFCGHQHAKMGLVLVAESPERFAAWYEAQLRPAPPPRDSVARRGQTVFLSSACVMCHTVRGTPAGSRMGPDLTHLATRRTIAAATLPNTRGHLAGWIVDPQRIKPGVRMPPNRLAPHELDALLAYLEGLR